MEMAEDVNCDGCRLKAVALRNSDDVEYPDESSTGVANVIFSFLVPSSTRLSSLVLMKRKVEKCQVNLTDCNSSPLSSQINSQTNF